MGGDTAEMKKEQANQGNIKRIKSFYITKIVISCLSKKTKLKIIKFNKKFQKKLKIAL